MSLQSCMAFKSAALAGISIDRLNTLCAVIEAGTIVSAAGPDPNRQSQFSRQLKDLEQALGIPLFERIGKSLRANDLGRRVALAAQTFFAALDDVMDTAAARAETVRLGAGESVLRWLVMPHLPELMAGESPLRFEIHNFSTEMLLKELTTGGVDLAIARSDAITDDLQREEIATLHYVLVVPRTLLRTKEGAEVFEGKPLPFAELAGDGVLSRTVGKTADSLGINLHSVLAAQTFSLLIAAVESGTAAAFLPDLAARHLPEARFAVVSADPMRALDRILSLVWKSEVAEARLPIRRAIVRLKRVLSGTVTSPAWFPDGQ